MRRFLPLFALALATNWFAPPPAQAGQPRDWIIGRRPTGTVVNLDVVFPGIQSAIEHRENYFGTANELLLRSELTVAYPITELRLDADIRILVLTLGLSAGARDVYQNLRLGDDPKRSRPERQKASDDLNDGNDIWAWVEGRARLSLPINDYVLYDSINVFRSEGRDRASFDWRRGVAHDGDYFRSTNWLYVHHPDWGGVAPILDIFHFRANKRPDTLIGVGIALLTRPGFFRRDDVMLFQIISVPWSDHFGMHLLNVPIVTAIGYRVVLGVPSTDIDEDAPSYFEDLY